MSAETDAKPNPPVSVRSGWQWPAAWVVTILILVLAGIYVFRACIRLPGRAIEKTGQLVEQIGKRVADVVSAFNQGTVNTTFTSYATSISGNQYLQFATLSQRERFTRTDEASTAFGYVPLPDLIIEADAPVTYTYYLDLNDRWDFQLKNGAITVIAPDIRFNKPAVDVSRMTYEVKKDSHFRRTEPAIEGLKNSITWMTYKKARDNIELVRETGRRQTETFVQNWLAKSFPDGTNYPVTVRFRNEVKAADAKLQGKSDRP